MEPATPLKQELSVEEKIARIQTRLNEVVYKITTTEQKRRISNVVTNIIEYGKTVEAYRAIKKILEDKLVELHKEL